MLFCIMRLCSSFFYFKQKTAYEMRISDWSSDVCSSDLIQRAREKRHGLGQVKNMDAIPLAEDVWLHARIPAVCLVAEMRAGLNQLLHGDDRCRHSLSPSG